jgi:hypothetical protein
MKTNEIEDPDTNLCNYSHLIFKKEPRLCVGVNILFSTNGTWKNEFFTVAAED